MTLEHGAAVATALPQGWLAVLPGTHALPVENPEVVNALLLWFLADAGRQLAPPHNSVADRGLGKPASRKARWRCPRCHGLAAERMPELDDADS